MKKQYQKRKQGAAERFQSWAASNPKPVRLSFATADIAALTQQSLGELLRTVGKLFLKLHLRRISLVTTALN